MTGTGTRLYGRVSGSCVLVTLALMVGAESASGAQPSRSVGADEVPKLRTEHSQTRRLAPGVYETTLSGRALNYRDASGTWQPIDNELKRRSDGSLETRSNSVDVEIPETAAGDVHFADGDDRLSFSLAGAASRAVDVAGEVATFEEVVQDVDLEYEADGRVLKETLTLASADAPADFRFDVSSGDLRPELMPSGDVAFVDEAGRRQIGFAAPWMRDAGGNVTRAARYELTSADGRDQVVLRLDAGWLDDADRRFPVVVDPTVYSDREHFCEIRSGTRSSTTYCDGAVTDLWAGRDPNGVVHRKLLDLGDLSEVVPAYAQVLEGQLAVRISGQDPVEAADLDLHHLTRDFAPGATWLRSDGRTPWSRPGGDYDPQLIQRRSTAAAGTGGWLAFDLTELTQRIVARVEPSSNVLLKAADETRTHVDAFDDGEVTIRWTHRTGISPLFTYEDWPLSDGSTLRLNVANGNFVVVADDIDLESDDGRFTVGRYINSLNLDGTDAPGTFGMGTRGDFGSITLQQHELSGSYAFSGPGAETGVFLKRSDGSFTPPPGMDASLSENLDGTKTIVFDDTTETWTFDTSGQLIQTRQDWGYTIDGVYGADGLTRLTDSVGHSATFTYDTLGRMRTITDQDLREQTYGYDGADRLTSYTSPTAASTVYTYDWLNRMTRLTMPDGSGLRISYYGNSSLPHLFTPFDTSGVDGPATSYDGETDFGEIVRPAAARRVYFFDPSSLVVDLFQHGESAAIGAAGSILDLHGRYTRGDATLAVDVAAAHAWAGIQTTSLKVDGIVVDALGDAPCDRTTCPTRSSTRLYYDPTFDAEGTYEYRVETTDGDDQETSSPTWRIAVDRTPPTVSATRFEELFDSDAGRFDVYWDGAEDPALADATPGQVAAYRTRYQRNLDAWSEWTVTKESGIHVEGTQPADSLTVEVQAIDGAGNVGPTASETFTARARSDRLILVIWSRREDERYRFTPTLASGQSLRVVDGGRRVIAVDGADRELETIASVDATDDADEPVAMTYSLDGADVVVDIEHRADGVRYPVVADTNQDGSLRVFLNRLRELLRRGPPSSSPSLLADGDPSYIEDKPWKWCVAHGRAICRLFEQDAHRAERMVEHLFRVDRDLTRGNAFKHAYWIALMTQTAGHYGGSPGRGEDFGKAYEGPEPDENTGAYWRREMDLHNNHIGAQWVIDYEESSPLPRYPTDREICREIFAKAKVAQYSMYGPWDRNRLVFRALRPANSWISVAEPCRDALSTSR